MSGMVVYVTLPGYIKEPIYVSLTATVQDFCRAVLDKTGVKVFDGFGFAGQDANAQVPKASAFVNATGFNATTLQPLAFATYGTGAPAQPVGTPSTASGTLPATTYYVKVTYLNATGESLPSVESAGIVLSGTGNIVITSPAAQVNATTYNVYISSVQGSGWKLQSGSPVNIGTNYTQSTTLNGAGAAVPTADTTLNPALSSVTINKFGINAGDEIQFWSSPAY
jgi:hypothetical protein